MSTIHDQIQKYIHGKLTDDEIDRLWMNFLHQPIWYDYFITELTSKKVISSQYEEQQSHVQVLWSKLKSTHQERLQSGFK